MPVSLQIRRWVEFGFHFIDPLNHNIVIVLLTKKLSTEAKHNLRACLYMFVLARGKMEMHISSYSKYHVNVQLLSNEILASTLFRFAKIPSTISDYKWFERREHQITANQIEMLENIWRYRPNGVRLWYFFLFIFWCVAHANFSKYSVHEDYVYAKAKWIKY